MADRFAGRVASLLIVAASLTVVTAAVSTGSAFASGPGQGPTRWKLQPSPDPQVKNDGLSQISCGSGNFCMAVGGALGGTGERGALAELWNGSSWTTTPTTVPSGSAFSQLTSVSCPSDSSCEAVGNYEAADGTEEPLAELWDGASWTVQDAAEPSAGGSLDGVSCTTQKACMAVGFAITSGNGGGVPFAQAWNGSEWTSVSVPDPDGASNAELSGVSCVARICEAVGQFDNANGIAVTLGEAWDGSSWAIQEMPTPTKWVVSEDLGVSCTSSDFCVAVGDSISSSTGILGSLAETWNGKKWTVSKTPNPAGAFQTRLYGVSCFSDVSCSAVGQTTVSGASGPTSVAMGWNGVSWSLEALPEGRGQDAALFGAECVSGSDCWAVGDDTTANNPSVAISYNWNGSVWSESKVSNEPGLIGAAIYGVDCPAVAECLAVGSDALGRPVAELRNGSTWRLKSVPGPSGGGALKAISCFSTRFCMAVGLVANYSSDGLAEEWNGSAWRRVRTAHQEGILTGVSCASATSCVAVGDIPNAQDNPVPASETWDGKSWTAVAAPLPAGGAEGVLQSVSCTAVGSCTAAGVWYGAQSGAYPLIETWNGSAWTIASAAQSKTSVFLLTGISCSRATYCVAVGYTINDLENSVAVSEVWDGTSWTLVKMPALPGGSQINSVSCRGAVCVAAGERGDGTLAETWNGTSWTVDKTQNPSGSDRSGTLEGVSCAAASSCTAAGYYTSSDNLELTLVETGT